MQVGKIGSNPITAWVLFLRECQDQPATADVKEIRSDPILLMCILMRLFAFLAQPTDLPRLDPIGYHQLPGLSVFTRTKVCMPPCRLEHEAGCLIDVSCRHE